MMGVRGDGNTNAPTMFNTGIKSVSFIDGKAIGADGLPVNFNLDAGTDSSGDEQDKSASKSYASVVNDQATTRKVNFRTLDIGQPSDDKVDVLIPMSSVREANSRFEHTMYGYFIGKRVAFPVVEHYVLNAWKKYGLVKTMMNANGFFFFKFNSAIGSDQVLEKGGRNK